MNLTVMHAADTFISVLREAPQIAAFLSAQTAMESDEELKKLREAYNEAAKHFQERQFSGALTREDISELRRLQAVIEAHLLWNKFLDARSEAVELLRSLNQAMGDVLGFDFASAASPPGC